MENDYNSKRGYLCRTIVLLVSGVLYLLFVMLTFAFKIDLAAAAVLQDIIHVTVIVAAFAYLLFTDMIYSLYKDKANGRLALLFAALFTVPVLIGRGIGISYISNPGIFSDSSLNFYARVSLTMTIEVISWTTFFPMSMLFLSKLFFGIGKGFKLLAALCLTASICCFTAFLSFFSSNPVFFFIGLSGWGIIFLLIVIIYFVKQIKDYSKKGVTGSNT